jgi:hypothetical protein
MHCVRIEIGRIIYKPVNRVVLPHMLAILSSGIHKIGVCGILKSVTRTEEELQLLST